MKCIDGYWWPENDKDCHKVIHGHSKDLDLSLKHVKEFSVCVQAGGNVGVWPKILAQKFKHVYTFEPDPENFECLVRNCPERNIVKFQAALGYDRGLITVQTPDAGHVQNCGAYQVFEDGYVPTLRIDDLGLTSCGFLSLDVEGYELFALEGAVETIEKFRPVVTIEDKDLPFKYGVKVGEPEKWLAELGYRVADRVHRDVICVPSS